MQQRIILGGTAGTFTQKYINFLLYSSRAKEEIIDEILRSPKTEDHKQKIAKALKGRPAPWAVGNKNAAVLKGRPRTEETKQKIANSKIGKERPDMVGNNYATALKGRKKTDEHKQAVINALNSQEVKDKISASWAIRPKVKCPHCSKEGTQGHNMKRYHFDNCKERK